MNDAKGLLKREVRQIEPTPGGLERTMERVRRRERTRRALASTLALAMMAGVIGWLWGVFSPNARLPERPLSSPLEAAATSGWQIYRDDEHGFSVAYPATWLRAAESLTPLLSDPQEILSVGTYELRAGGDRCAQFPDRALDDLGKTDALVTLQEDSSTIRPGAPGFPPRPPHFGAESGRGDDESPGCVSEPKDFFHRWIPFHDRGRSFYAYVAMGSAASPQTQEEAWAILDSLEFDPAPDAAARPDCGVISQAPEEYSSSMIPDRGPAGTRVIVSGPTLRGEDGRYAPADRIEFWWNTDVPLTEVPNAQPLTPGPILRLAREDISSRCNYSVSFVIPDVPPGEYRVEHFVYHEDGYGFGLGHVFEVPSATVIERLPLDPEEEFGYELPPITTFQPLGAEGCRPPSPLVVTESLATSEDITVWALLLTNVPTSELAVGDEAKVVWRSDGSGDFDVIAISPSGDRVRSEIPVTSHLSSNWERPGSEWQSWFGFSEPGCWQFQVRHGGARAQLWLEVDR